MSGKVILGSICAGLTLLIALNAEDKVTETSATFACSCFLSFTATSLVLDKRRERKSQEQQASDYLQVLRQLNQAHAIRESQRPIACQGCQHYHGRSYGGNLLVCGMHPYGVEDATCADWEGNDQDA